MGIYASWVPEGEEHYSIPFDYEACWGFLSSMVKKPKLIHWWLPSRLPVEEVMEAMFPVGHKHSPKWTVDRDIKPIDDEWEEEDHCLVTFFELDNIPRRPMMIRLFAIRNAFIDGVAGWDLLKDREDLDLRSKVFLGGNFYKYHPMFGEPYYTINTGDGQLFSTTHPIKAIAEVLNLEFDPYELDVWSDGGVCEDYGYAPDIYEDDTVLNVISSTSDDKRYVRDVLTEWRNPEETILNLVDEIVALRKGLSNVL